MTGHKSSFVSRFLKITILLIGMLPFSAHSQAQSEIERLAGNGSVLLLSPSRAELVNINSLAPLIPASLIKIPLAQIARSTLGEDFRFETHFYRNEQGDLLIQGLGDPFLVSEEIALISDALKQRGLHEVQRVVVDDSAFEGVSELPQEGNANDPYAARNSALAVNFNTVNLDWSADGTLVSGESQTPLTAIAQELASNLNPGQAQRINLGRDPENGLKQAQQLFIYFLQESGINISDQEFYHESATNEWSLFYRHRSSTPLNEILTGMLRYSNNFIANQIFLTLGAQNIGYPSNTDSARAKLVAELEASYGDGFGNNPELLFMQEGSGLSRQQRSSAAGIMRILINFEPISDLLPEINGVLRKSGTLTGVYNFAGFIIGGDGLYPFVILTNQSVNNRDEILEILKNEYVN